jgi:hypothetical protein
LNKEEARRAILAEWRAWAIANNKINPNGMDGLMFFSDISREKPELLRFRAYGDRWQVAQPWPANTREPSQEVGSFWNRFTNSV